MKYSIYPMVLAWGCGVTAFDYSDAISLLNKTVFLNLKMPSIKKVVENVDIRNLDEGHVIPNMSSPDIRGIWFPLGFQ